MGPPGMHRAYTATMMLGPHYEADYGPRYELHYDLTLYAELRSNARRTNDCYCTTVPLDLQAYTGRYILMEILGSTPLIPAAGSNNPNG